MDGRPHRTNKATLSNFSGVDEASVNLASKKVTDDIPSKTESIIIVELKVENRLKFNNTTVFHHISKHFEVRRRNPLHRIFNSPLDIWNAMTHCVLFLDMLHQEFRTTP